MNLPKTARRSLCVLAALFILFLIVVGIFLIPPSPSLPNPNGYDDLVAAGSAITINIHGPSTINDYLTLDPTNLRDLIETNQEPLRRLHVGLSRQCAVPLEKETNVVRDLPALRSLAILTKANGHLAEIESRPADAARSYIDTMRVGIEISRGGTLINRLVGIACEGMGNISFVKLLPKLTCEQLPLLIKELEQADQNYVPWREVIRCENHFVVVEFRKNPISLKEIPELWESRKVRKTAQRKHNLAEARLRLLIVEMALRCYQCDHQNIPQNLTQLVPKYLQRIPADPFNDNPLIYHPTGTNWLLYSVGPDGVDNGGTPFKDPKSLDYIVGLGVATPDQYHGDLSYNSPW